MNNNGSYSQTLHCSRLLAPAKALYTSELNHTLTHQPLAVPVPQSHMDDSIDKSVLTALLLAHKGFSIYFCKAQTCACVGLH
jgi:hypothetical protein